MPVDKDSRKLKVIIAFLAVYLVWGSTYLGILYAIETIPPWALTSMRFVVASFCMFLIAKAKGQGAVTPEQRKIAMVSGVLLVLANGVVCVIEKWVSSGIAAVVIGAMPIWIMLIGWMSFGTGRPAPRKILGACIGLVGIGLIAAGDAHASTSGTFAQFAPLVLCVSSVLWASGTLIQRRAQNVQNGFSFLAVQMASGAVAAIICSLLFDAPMSYDWSLVTSKSWLALLYLIIFGSLIGFTAYSWLSRNVEPHLVSTYALVNPVIAVWLGWGLANEPLTGKFVTSTILVVVGLAVLMWTPRKKSAVT